MGWLDEHTVVFSIGGGTTILRTQCYPKPTPRCEEELSLRLWDIEKNQVRTLMDGAWLRCIAANRMTIVSGKTYHTGRIGGVMKDTGLEAGRSYDWDRCLPSEPQYILKDGRSVPQYQEEWGHFYDFRDAYFQASRKGLPRTQIIWRTLDGREETQDLPKGPWNNWYRLSESYYPTKAGVLVAGRQGNYFVRSKGYKRFFPGSIVSRVGVSPYGCGVAFFGAKSAGQTTEVKLYTTQVC